MPGELRVAFHRSLDEIDRKVVELYALIAERVAAATAAFLETDVDAARALSDSDSLIDDLYVDIEGLVQHQLSLQAPMARDLRFLLTVLRIVPELERCGDLAEHIAQRATRGITGELTPRIRGLVEQMGKLAGDMWQQAAEAYSARDADAADRLEDLDDRLDELHSSITAEIVAGSLSLPVVLEMGLVARFYERLGDHAVNVAKRTRYIATGS